VSARSRAVGLAVAGTVAVMLLGGCLRDIGDTMDGLGWPEGGITDRSERMYDMWIGSAIAAIVVGLLVWGLIFWCVVRYRKRGEELPVQTRYNLPIEVLYTIVPFLVVAVLVLPTGQIVRFELTSQDVIHSFWVPELLFKRDVFPGNIRNVFEVTIQVDKEGRYVGRCAELCGTYHSMMTFELRAVAPDSYQQYVSALESGQTQAAALQSIGEDPYATTTEPFDTRRS
jgi:cytochrome c oxidase subunit II